MRDQNPGPAVGCFHAPATAAAYRYSRQILAAHPGPGELYAAAGAQPGHLDTIHLGA